MSGAETTPTQGKTARTVVGRVVSNKMDKSVTVAVERLIRHPVYGKFIRRTTQIVAHDEANACGEGDLVAIAECRPISKRKAWRVVEIVQSAAGASAAGSEAASSSASSAAEASPSATQA
jgi:small subunit ribosomal protein S17